jgi:hypothetical protein
MAFAATRFCPPSSAFSARAISWTGVGFCGVGSIRIDMPHALASVE